MLCFVTCRQYNVAGGTARGLQQSHRAYCIRGVAVLRGNDMRFAGAVSNEPKSNTLLGKVLEGAMVGYLDNVFKLAGRDLQASAAAA